MERLYSTANANQSQLTKKGGRKALPHQGYQNNSPIKRMNDPPWGVCPACGRALGPYDRVAWALEGWRRGAFVGCEGCSAPRRGREVLAYEVWEAPEVWFLND